MPKMYINRGIPYRRGYLLHGPPGTGKSSFISALAALYGHNICMLSLSDRLIDDAMLNHLMHNAPLNSRKWYPLLLASTHRFWLWPIFDPSFSVRLMCGSNPSTQPCDQFVAKKNRRKSFLITETSFLVIEDVDSAFGGRHDGVIQHNPVYDGLSRVTMSGLLNAVDGVASAEGGRVLFMTTNHVERLDAALIRPGRVDVSQHFGNCTPIMFEQMFKRFFENVPDTLCSKFCDKMLSIGIECSPATIQGHLLNFKNQPGLAIENIEKLKS
uniref:AAA+ ATPase domain-containing protein n=1 Tax=Meloidogyne incognita TaxID=6306 RepID=A0A914L0U5_MELIC